MKTNPLKQVDSLEIAALMKIRNLIDLKVYLALRAHVNLTTGELARSYAKTVNAEVIAREISVPARQGAKALKFERFDVRHSLIRLVSLGLIDELATEDRFLKLRLVFVGR